MAHRLLRDLEADGWERSDFPIICESCLGDNPYVRMVRDTALSINSNDAIPKSDVNREYFAEEHDRRARAGLDYESSYGKVRPNDTILKLQRTTPYYKRNRAHVCSFYIRGECTRGAECPYRHEMPITGELSQQNIKDRYYGYVQWLMISSFLTLEGVCAVGLLPPVFALAKGVKREREGCAGLSCACVGLLPPVSASAKGVKREREGFVGEEGEGEAEAEAGAFWFSVKRVNDPVALKLLNKAGEMPSLEPPEDESIRTLYVGGLNERVIEQDLRDNFYAHGEIESIRMVPLRACAFVTYTTREGAEKAAEELSNKLVIKGLRLKLMWGRPQLSQQQSQYSHPLWTKTNQHYFIPPPPQKDRAFYPSMDPQRMGAVVPSHEGASTGPSGSGENKSGSEKQQQGHHYAYQAMPPPHGQYHQQPFYPPYGFMPPMPPYQQVCYTPEISTPSGSSAHPVSTSGSAPPGSTQAGPGPSGSSTSGSSQQ
uniref:C3H1-type domain-containing protein n=1 Tax=Fagus sylvatica TaxID=28930 RepID=A0A2N9HXP1_FAGSY